MIRNTVNVAQDFRQINLKTWDNLIFFPNKKNIPFSFHEIPTIFHVTKDWENDSENLWLDYGKKMNFSCIPCWNSQPILEYFPCKTCLFINYKVLVVREIWIWCTFGRSIKLFIKYFFQSTKSFRKKYFSKNLFKRKQNFEI